MPSKKKRPPPLDLQIEHEEDDGLKRMARLSTIFQSEAFQKDDKPKAKKKKRGPYDPEVYHTIEQIRQEVDEEEIRKKPGKRRRELEDDDALAQQLDQTIQQMTPVNSPVKAVLEKTTLLEEGEEPPRVCPFHLEPLVPVVNDKGYKLTKCSDQPCLISVFDDQNTASYLDGVYNKVHKDIHDVWSQLLCDCGFLPGLRQSKSEKNPERMYLACRHHQCKYFHWADEPLADPTDVMTCPRHLKKMEERTSQTGWKYLRCPGIPCFLFCGKDQGPKYMAAARQNIHPDVCNRWDKMNCICGHYPILKQSWSEKNPGRLYLSCGDNNKCKFFRWADQPVLKENLKDPLAVQDWLQDIISPANPPPIYGEGLVQAEQRLQQTKRGSNPEMVEIDPPVLYQDYVPLHKDVIERGKLRLF